MSKVKGLDLVGVMAAVGLLVFAIVGLVQPARGAPTVHCGMVTGLGWVCQ